MNFNFKTNYILENERVLLRPLINTDYNYLLEYSLNEPEIWRYNAWGAAGAENLKKYIENAIKQREMEREYPFIVFDKQSNKFVGSTRFYDFQFERKTIQLGYTWYGKNYQGTGINKNCKYLMLTFMFDQMGVERVGFGANSKNEKSINAMKSIGCTVEGILRSNSIGAQNERIDNIVLSILKNEWESEIKENLKMKSSSYGNTQ